MSQIAGPQWGHEDKVWVERNPDGLLNPNSFAAIGAFGTVTYAVEVLTWHDQPLTPATVRGLSRVFAGVEESVQQSLIGSVSGQDGMNTRLRGALRTVVNTIPLPFGGTSEAWQEWSAAATQRMHAIAFTALMLWTHGPGEHPWTDLVAAPGEPAAVQSRPQAV